MDVYRLKSDGFVSIPYPHGLRSAVRDAMEAWQEFCLLPASVKRLLSGGDRLKDFGYMKREDVGPKSDNKELFHASRATLPLLQEKAESITDRRGQFFTLAHETMLREMEPFVLAYAAAIEARFGVTGYEEAARANQDRWIFRYLNYLGGTVLANAHADRGGFTFHLYESDGGGEYLDFSRTWRSWPVSADETIIFPSVVSQHFSKCQLEALWHRVVANQKTSVLGRQSMVAFIDLVHPYRFNDSRFRLQEMPEGFNYGMGFQEFGAYFVER